MDKFRCSLTSVNTDEPRYSATALVVDDEYGIHGHVMFMMDSKVEFTIWLNGDGTYQVEDKR